MKNNILPILILVAAIIIILIFSQNQGITNFAIKENNYSSNLILDIPESHKKINPGEDIWFTLKLLNLANENRIDVTITFEIKDSDNSIIISKSETVAIETQASFVRQLKIPDESPNGRYNIYAKVIYPDNNEVFAQNSFEVSNLSEKNSFPMYYTILIIFAIILLTIIILIIKKLRPVLENMKIKSKIHKIVKIRKNMIK
ncbi:hypothetical protein GOV12_04550 [Candidatus Pacearchaeota archaeon]|nr:hypothetical protein [Candidatus Pacearchaeota archaeon]